MKQPKRLSRAQKILLARKGVNTKDHLLIRELPNSLILVNKTTKECLVVEK